MTKRVRSGRRLLPSLSLPGCRNNDFDRRVWRKSDRKAMAEQASLEICIQIIVFSLKTKTRFCIYQHLPLHSALKNAGSPKTTGAE